MAKLTLTTQIQLGHAHDKSVVGKSGVEGHLNRAIGSLRVEASSCINDHGAMWPAMGGI